MEQIRTIGRWRPFLGTLLCTVVPVIAQQPSAPADPWRVVPDSSLLDYPNHVPNSPTLVKSIGDAAEYLLRWRVPASAHNWRLRRPEVEQAFRKAIGLETLPDRTPLNPRIVATHDMGDYTLQNVIFESRPGFPVSANLYRPKTRISGKRAAIVIPIGHFLGPGKAAAAVQERAIGMTRQGFIVLAYDAVGQGERMLPGNIHHDAGYALMPIGETIAGWMVWDSMRAIDYLVSLSEVDPERIGITGNSGGGLNALFTAALDTRVRAAVVAGYTFEFSNWLKYAGSHCSCTHLPGIFRAMEWFEIAGLIAPRALLMLQGANDNIFPVSGARRAARSTTAIYALEGFGDRARFAAIAGQPHAYSQPFREQMYGWMKRHLWEEGGGDPIAEDPVAALPENDLRLRCDVGGAVFPKSATVVSLARRRALVHLQRLNPSRESVRSWAQEMAAPPEPEPHYLAARAIRSPRPSVSGTPRKITFNSEDGQYIPGLLWVPENRREPATTVIIADDRGKREVAGSPIVPSLIREGIAVFAVDLRGRGETLGVLRAGHTTSYRLTGTHMMFGRPLAGRRAFDLSRAVDYLAAQPDTGKDAIVVVGIGHDAPAALFAAAADPRIRQVAVSGTFHSFLSPMRSRGKAAAAGLPDRWNSPQVTGGLDAGDFSVDFSSTIYDVLKHADIPDILAAIAPRRVLFCQALDNTAPDADIVVPRFRRVVSSVGSEWIRYEPSRTLDADLLSRWISDGSRDPANKGFDGLLAEASGSRTHQ